MKKDSNLNKIRNVRKGKYATEKKVRSFVRKPNAIIQKDRFIINSLFNETK